MQEEGQDKHWQRLLFLLPPRQQELPPFERAGGNGEASADKLLPPLDVRPVSVGSGSVIVQSIASYRSSY